MGPGDADPRRHRVGAGQRRNASGSNVNRDEPETGQTVQLGSAVSTTELVPRQPPGRSSRKARAYSAEIARLLALGHTLVAIREALADAGVMVSKSTVQREAARLALGPSAARPPHLTHPRPSTAGDDVPAAEPLPSPTRQSGRDIAEAFVRSRITNPLLQKSSP